MVVLKSVNRDAVSYTHLAYYHTTAEYARNYTLTIQGSLAGYNTRDDGVIVVANGDRKMCIRDRC